ncbi:sulfatase [Fulvimarina sp. 2208YS6-2-32]|uniref:Sulfatase n=1 Tax=Fulvimarina uroteuthidis TaxID=3098149 RepID=A0ABU5I1Y8_9HYPH|nr:sulfatase-like hydrolase/transferase [Fulvimarina sp. 2208YS6-2-32]MDY8109378.1 sulfatase [Fulvimarina sp. 2208YS6-2-32]
MSADASHPAHPEPPRRNGGIAAGLRFAAGCLLLAAILFLPERPVDLERFSPGAVPVELLAAIGLVVLAAGSSWLFRASLIVICSLAGIILFLKLADLGTFTAFGRPFNPLLDLIIIKDGWNLLTGTIGRTEAAAVIAAAILAWSATVLLLGYCLAGARRMARAKRMAACGLVVALAAIGVLFARLSPGESARAAILAPTASTYLTTRVALMRRSAIDLAAFEKALEGDPLSDLDEGTLLDALKGRDVYVLFVESYGRTVLADETYRALIAPRLSAIEADLRKAGLAARSGWMTSPTVGGQSWLAHGALLAGLPTTDQSRYDRMIASRRKSLNTLFREAGWHTIGIMPAISMEWPEGGYYGYDELYVANTLGYEGLPFNWVTMPDQFTLAAAKRAADAASGPVMVEAALISSHAPWTPIPRLVPWDDVGDGRIFDAQALAGDPPSVVWAEPDRIRDHYIRSIDYALETIGDFIAKFGEDAVFVVLGDHQPSRLLTGDGAPRDVPFHIIANDRALLERLDGMDLVAAMTPDETSDTMAMWDFRERFVNAMSGAESDGEPGIRPGLVRTGEPAAGGNG